MDYEVIIAGAGPAGAMAAWQLAKAGRRVLVLEKKQLGRDKPCGGGLSRRAYANLEIEISDLVLARTEQVALQMDGRSLVRLNSPGESIWMVRRRDFDRRLAEAAIAAGAALHEEEPVTAASTGTAGVTVQTEKGSYTAAVLLLATGAEGNLRNSLGLEPTEKRVPVAIELEVPVRAGLTDQHTAILDCIVPQGYAWAFPKGAVWNIGVASTNPQLGPELRDWLARFLQRNGIEFADPEVGVQAVVGRRLPVWSGKDVLAKGRVALLGDAARLADPFWGEGIASALMSGRVAAKLTLAYLDGQVANLDGYTEAIRTELGPHLNRMHKIARLIYPAPGLWIRVLAHLPLARKIAGRVIAEPFSLRRNRQPTVSK